MNIQFANQTGNATQYTIDIITGDSFTHKLTSHIIDGQQRLTIKKDGFKIAVLQPEHGKTVSQDEAKDWTKATIIAIREKLDQLNKATSQASEAEVSYREALK